MACSDLTKHSNQRKRMVPYYCINHQSVKNFHLKGHCYYVDGRSTRGTVATVQCRTSRRRLTESRQNPGMDDLALTTSHLTLGLRN